MRIEISDVVVEEHHRRLREAAQAPANPLIATIWTILTRRSPAPVTQIARDRRELERLAA